METTAQDASDKSQPQTVPLLLRIVLAVVAVHGLVWFYYANSHTDEYYLAYPRFEPWLWNLYLTAFLASLVGIFALWSLHQWGFWLLAVLALLTAAIEIYAMGFTLRMMLIPAAIAAIWFALQPVWKSLR